jgi:hypothetical protein
MKRVVAYVKAISRALEADSSDEALHASGRRVVDEYSVVAELARHSAHDDASDASTTMTGTPARRRR